MKKTIKIVGWILFCAVLLALTLPFVFSDKTEADGPSMKVASPQVYSANPFTQMMNRLRNLFANNKDEDVFASAGKTETDQTAASSPRRAALKNSRAANKRNKKENKRALLKDRTGNAVSDENAAAPDSLNAEFPADDWVLGEQKAPQIAAKGMHETKLTDSVYARQRAQANTEGLLASAASADTAAAIPTARTAGKTSAWQTYVANPIKHLFGLDKKNSASSGNGSAGRSGLGAGAIASASGGRSAARSGSSRSAATPAESRRRTMDNINETIRDIATLRADMKYPNPQTDRERAAREQMIRKEIIREKVKQNNAFLQQIQKEERRQPPQKDVLESLITNLKSTASDENVPIEKVELGYLVPIDGWYGRGTMQALAEGANAKQPSEAEKEAAKQRVENLLKEAEKFPPAMLISEIDPAVFDNPEHKKFFAGTKQQVNKEKQKTGEEQTENPLLSSKDDSTTFDDLGELLKAKGCDAQKCYFTTMPVTPENKTETDEVNIAMAEAGLRYVGDLANSKDVLREILSQKAGAYYAQQLTKENIQNTENQLGRPLTDAEKQEISNETKKDLEGTVGKKAKEYIEKAVEERVNMQTISILTQEEFLKQSADGVLAIPADFWTKKSLAEDLNNATANGNENLPAAEDVILELHQFYPNYNLPMEFVEDLKTAQGKNKEELDEKQKELSEQMVNLLVENNLYKQRVELPKDKRSGLVSRPNEKTTKKQK